MARARRIQVGIIIVGMSDDEKREAYAMNDAHCEGYSAGYQAGVLEASMNLSAAQAEAAMYRSEESQNE